MVVKIEENKININRIEIWEGWKVKIKRVNQIISIELYEVVETVIMLNTKVKDKYNQLKTINW